MGCMSSKPADPADKDALQQNSRIDRMIRNDKKRMDRTIKILLLGMYLVSWSLVHMLILLLRCWRVGQVNNHKTNEDYSLPRLPRR